MTIDYDRFNRAEYRCEEVAHRPDADASVRRVYDERVASEANAYRSAHTAVKNAEKKAKKERKEALAALEQIDQPYRQARAVTALYVTDLALPLTLKALTTDTDRKNAISQLLGILDEHDDEPGWAQDLTAGEFGRLAPIAIREIEELIASDADLEKAVRDRAAAYGPAYERYLRFKQVVRETYGSSSMHYRRIHVRSSGKLAADDPVDVGTDDSSTDTDAGGPTQAT